MAPKIEVTDSEKFSFAFIKEHDGRGIPTPLPESVLSLIEKGLVKCGQHFESENKTQCFITDLGKKF